MTSAADCIFCKIVTGDIPCFKVHEDDTTLAFMDINPVSEGHALVIPKAHYENVVAISEAAMTATAAATRKVAAAVQAALEPAGMNLFQCNGEAANQTVMHFHMHVIPRQAGDALAMNWPLVPGDMDAIAAVAGRIRARL